MADIWFNPETGVVGPGAFSHKRAKQFAKKYGTWYQYYLQLFIKLSAGRYVWEGLPDYVTSSYIERQLTNNGMVFAVRDELGKLQFVPGTTMGNNTYEQPITGNTNSVGSAALSLIPSSVIFQGEGANAVYIADNSFKLPQMYQIQFWAEQLAGVKGKIDANLRTISTPIILSGTPRTIKALSKQLASALEGDAIIVEDADATDAGVGLASSIQAINTNPVYLVDQLNEYHDKLWATAIEQLGINTASYQKKERMLYDEVNANNDLISRYTSDGLEVRRQAADAINKMFGTNITVNEPRVEEDNSIKPEAEESTNTNIGGTENDNSERMANGK